MLPSGVPDAESNEDAPRREKKGPEFTEVRDPAKNQEDFNARLAASSAEMVAKNREVDWDEVQQALEGQADTGVRAPILAMAARLDSARFAKMSANVMAPRKAEALRKQNEMKDNAKQRERDAAKRMAENNARVELRMQALVDKRLRELGVLPETAAEG